jgi:hypothetical protein
VRRPGVLVALVLLVGIAGGAIALRSREGNTEFISQQQTLAPVAAVALERLIATTSDPRPGSSGHARGVRCSAGATSALGDPWTCVVRYPRLPRVRYRVTVYADRSIHGSGQPEGRPLGSALSVRGCCVGGG